MPYGHSCTSPGGVRVNSVGGTAMQCRACGERWNYFGPDQDIEVTHPAEDRSPKSTVLSDRRAAQKAGMTTTATLSATADAPAKKARKAVAKKKK